MAKNETERQAYWRKHVEAWQEGTETQKAYCQRHGLNYQTFGYWKTRLGHKGARKVTEKERERRGLSNSPEAMERCPYTTSKPGAPTGRPKSIETPEDFDELVDQHVTFCIEEGMPITWTGMALALGLSSRTALHRYDKDRPEFSDSARRARNIVEQSYEVRVNYPSPTGAIFVLKNLGWKDQSEVDHRSGDGSMSPRPLTDFYATDPPPGVPGASATGQVPDDEEDA